MPGGNFDYELVVQPNGVVLAHGPLDATVTAVTEMCLWVFQKRDEDDAIAQDMGPVQQGQPGRLHVFDLGNADARWEFSLPHRWGSPAFVDGSATAVGIGVFKYKEKDGEGEDDREDDHEEEHQVVYEWSEAVTLDVH